tara:strand:+ start:423 stop:674 length:252 start_codon:yes stop_codon:yes gene_type:complete
MFWVKYRRCKMYTSLNKEDFEVIFDVLNTYDPNDIQDVYPAMGEKEFIDGVQDAWRKVFKIVRLNRNSETSSSVFHRKEVQDV